MSDIKPYKIKISNEDLEDLKGRLSSTRWPEKETVEDWSQGVPLSYIKEIHDYWINDKNAWVISEWSKAGLAFIETCSSIDTNNKNN